MVLLLMLIEVLRWFAVFFQLRLLCMFFSMLTFLCIFYAFFHTFCVIHRLWCWVFGKLCCNVFRLHNVVWHVMSNDIIYARWQLCQTTILSQRELPGIFCFIEALLFRNPYKKSII